jgi:hypothetical protein
MASLPTYEEVLEHARRDDAGKFSTWLRDRVNKVSSDIPRSPPHQELLIGFGARLWQDIRLLARPNIEGFRQEYTQFYSAFQQFAPVSVSGGKSPIESAGSSGSGPATRTGGFFAGLWSGVRGKEAPTPSINVNINMPPGEKAAEQKLVETETQAVKTMADISKQVTKDLQKEGIHERVHHAAPASAPAEATYPDPSGEETPSKTDAVTNIVKEGAEAAAGPEVAAVAKMIKAGHFVGKATKWSAGALSKGAGSFNDSIASKPVGAVRGFGWFVIMFGLMLYYSGIGNISTWVTPTILYFVVIPFFIWFIYLALTRDSYKDFLSGNGAFFVGALVVHTFLIRLFYSGDSVNLNLILMITSAVYFAFAVIYFVMSRNSDEEKISRVKTLGLLYVTSILIASAPGLIMTVYPNADLQLGLTYLAVMFSPWVIYALRKMREENPDGTGAAILRVYVLFVLAIPIIVFGGYAITKAVSLMPQTTVSGVSGSEGVNAFVDMVKTTFEKTMKRWGVMVDQVQNPGKYYTGQVEENSKAPLGVQIVSLYPNDKVTTTETEPLVFGQVRAKSFIGESILVTPTCIIDRKGMPPARVSPAVLEVIFSAQAGYTCKFPPLPVGTYTIKSAVTFPFETWAYVPFTFVSEETARDIARRQQDIRTVFSIPENPIVTYTAGPVQMGSINGSANPLIVRTTKDPIMPPGSQIGFTIENGWDTGGRINRVQRFVLKVPQPFMLTNCSRNLSQAPYPDDNDELYTDYMFDNPEFNEQVTWQGITCQLSIPAASADAAANLVSQGGAVTRSFIAVVDYEYSIEKKATLQVK